MSMQTKFGKLIVLSLICFSILVLVTACDERGRNVQSTPSQETPLLIKITEPLPTPTPTESPEPTKSPTSEASLIPYRTPDWFQNAVMYEIFVRSFADSDGNGIGDIQGIIERLDYLDLLNVEVIWLMPIYPSPSVHGYDVTDYYAVNPDYGTLGDIQELVRTAHDRGIRVILDFVPSHLSDQHPLFEDAFRNPDSPYSDWFVWTNDAHTTYASFAGSNDLPRFNHFNPEVVDYLIDAALFWLDLDDDGDYTDGVDGFRVDNVTFPPEEFFQTFRQGIKSANPEAILLGEAWVHTPSDLSRFFSDKFDALFDFPFYELLQGNHDFNGDGLLAGDGFPVLLTSLLAEESKSYPEVGEPVRFLSNHDTNRIATELGGNQDRLRLGAALLGSFPGPIMIYYGEEIGMFGQKGGPPFWDNYRREPMDWYAAESGPGQTDWFMPPDRWNQPDDGISVQEQDGDPDSLLSFYRKILEMRYTMPMFNSEDFRLQEMEVSAPGPWGFLRETDNKTVLALFNFADDSRIVTIQEFPFSAERPVDLLTGETFPAVESGQLYTITLPPAAAMWLSEE